MIESILPPTVSCRHTRVERDLELFPTEQAAIARAVATRRAEFTSVRWCARAALADLGHGPTALVPGEQGAPRWPPGVVGSMTHCPGYRSAAVARDSDVVSLGIDAEQDAPLPEGVAATVASPAELAALPRTSGVAWDRVLFSAKESVYKTWFPLTRQFLDFEEVDVRIDAAGTFTARLLVTGHAPSGEVLTGFSGRWVAADGLLATAVVLPAA